MPEHAGADAQLGRGGGAAGRQQGGRGCCAQLTPANGQQSASGWRGAAGQVPAYIMSLRGASVFAAKCMLLDIQGLLQWLGRLQYHSVPQHAYFADLPAG